MILCIDNDQAKQQHHDNINHMSSESLTEKRKRRRSGKVTIPKILKNDIRRYYIRMFMNTINSSDLFIVEDFFHTFMARPCRCVSIQTLQSELECPPNILVYGSRMITHYFLGIFLMFPDIIMKLVDSSIITSSGYTGSKIQIDMDIDATKVSSMPVEAWIPNETCLPLLYRQRNINDIVRVVRAFASADDMNINEQQQEQWLLEWMNQTPPPPPLQQQTQQHIHHHPLQQTALPLQPLPAMSSQGVGDKCASLALSLTQVDAHTATTLAEMSLLEEAAAHILSLTHASQTQTVDQPLAALDRPNEASSPNSTLHQLPPHQELHQLSELPPHRNLSEEPPATERRCLRSNSSNKRSSSDLLFRSRSRNSSTATNISSNLAMHATSNSNSSTNTSSSSGSSSSKIYTHTHIPTTYSDVVSQQLTPLPVPLRMKATARVTFYLDVSHHIQFLSLNLQNKNP